VSQILQEIFGRIEFEKQTQYKREVKKSCRLSEEKKKDYATGIIFYGDLIAKFIKSDFSTTDVNAIVKNVILWLISVGVLVEFEHHVSLSAYPIKKRYVF